MNIAILGCGNIANTHAQALTELGHKIICAIDTNDEIVKAFAKKWDVPYAGDDFNRALQSDVDSVHICTPPTLHYEMVKKVINAGKHVICEKPLCLDADEAKDLWELAKEKKVVSAVNFNVRYHEACQEARSVINSEDFGRVCLIHGSYLQEFHVLPADYMWRYIPELAGPMRATTEIGSHWIDLARYWTGLEITDVSANYGKFTPNRYIKDGVMYENELDDSKEITIDTDDVAVISLRFSNGAIGNLLLSEVSHGRSNYVGMEVSGMNKSVWWNSEDPYRLQTSTKFAGVTSFVNAFAGGFPNTFKNFFEAVYEDIQLGKPTDNPSYPTFYDGYKNAAVCSAVYNSANNNSIWMEVK